jgi:hypothetical protein
MFVFSHFFQPIHCFSRFHRLFDFCDAVMFSANIDLTQHKCHIVRPSRTVKHFQELSASLEEPFSRISSSCIPKYRWTLLNIGSYSGRQQFRGQSYIVKKVSGRTRYTVVHLSTWHQWKRNEVFKCTIRLHSNSKELAPSRDCWVFTVAASGRTRVKSENWEPRPLAIADPFHKHGSQACTSKATSDQTVAFNSKCERRTGAQHPNANGVMFLLNPITHV